MLPFPDIYVGLKWPMSVFQKTNLVKRTRHQLNRCIRVLFSEEKCPKVSKFTCADEKMCVDFWLVCDGRKDCGDGSDEDECSKYYI